MGALAGPAGEGRVNGWWAELREDGVAVATTAIRLARRRAPALVVALAALALATGAVWQWDARVHQVVTDRVSRETRRFAGRIRVWGAFNDTLVFAGTLYAAGRLRNRRRWRTAAVAAVMAGAFAGVAVNTVRITTGRPRPRANLPDRFTGPSLEWNRQSFPSGHSAASCASAAALVVATPGLGVAAAVSALLVTVASVVNRSHFLTDVLAGGGLGILVGWMFGQAARVRSAGLEANATRAQGPPASGQQ